MHNARIALPEVPPLETARLRLRGHRPSDFDECFAMWTDPGVVRFIGGRKSTREEVWSRVLRYIGHWSALGYGYWVMEEKGSGRFVGELGFADFHRELERPFEFPESGWALASWAHGQGFATEALKAILAWGDANLGAPHTVCMIDGENRPSIHVAKKCGYRPAGEATYYGKQTFLFERAQGAGR